MNLSDELYKEILGLLIGFVILIVGVISINKKKKLRKNGISVKGIVFEVVQSDTGSDRSMYYPVIRFVTKNQEWITEKYDVGGQYGAYVEGADVTVIYDPKEPKYFMLTDTRTNIIGVLFALVGLLLILASGVLMLL